MADTLKAEDQPISSIFSDKYQFRIPNYQRPYAWTKEQAEALFDDLITAIHENNVNGERNQYFLGSIVIIKKEHDPKSDIVDGQQRLTTLTILLAVLKQIWVEQGNEKGVKSVTAHLYNEGDDMLGRETGYRLSAREEDADFFRTNIQEPSGIKKLIANKDKLKDSLLRYRENATLLMEKASALSEDELEELWKFLAKECSLVVISTSDLEAAYRIFSVLNNRGLDLAPIDILKAEVLGKIRTEAGVDKSNQYAKKWGEIETKLGRDDFGHLLSHLRSIYAKQKAKAILLKEFQKFVTEYRENRPMQLIDDVIEPYAEVWSFVRNVDFEATEQAETINEYLSWLNRVNFKDWVPAALVYFKHFRQQPQKLAEFFQLLERLTYFLMVTKANTNERIETYARLMKEIEENVADGDLKKLPTLSLTEQQKNSFITALDSDIYLTLPQARMALVLRLESLMRAPGIKIENAISLEHVLPQNPPKGSEWLTWFPKEEVRDIWTHRLANLVLLDTRKNATAGNDKFSKKKEVYFKGKGTASPFVLTQDVREETEWTVSVLARRQKKLLGVLKVHWQLDNDNTPTTER